jgi:hypothetical protein
MAIYIHIYIHIHINIYIFMHVCMYAFYWFLGARAVSYVHSLSSRYSLFFFFFFFFFFFRYFIRVLQVSPVSSGVMVDVVEIISYDHTYLCELVSIFSCLSFSFEPTIFENNAQDLVTISDVCRSWSTQSLVLR